MIDDISAKMIKSEAYDRCDAKVKNGSVYAYGLSYK